MINVRELRPGNLVLRWGAPTTICGTQVLDHTAIVLFWDGNIVDQFGCQEIYPIPLTSEWLERLGFTTDGKGDDNHPQPLWHHPKTSYQFSDGAFVHNGTSYDDWHDIGNVDYLHQLQNLFFCLTGEELIIKQA